MTLNLLKRAEKGSALSATEHDNNFTAIETEVNAKLDSSDPSVSNSREWTAATATQAEAEAGTSTTRLAFTPQRIFQAIAAWWAASSAKTKLDGIEAGAEVNDVTSVAGRTGAVTLTTADVSGLGTAAAAATGDFATAAQGTKADSAMQASDVGTVASQVEVEAGTGTAVQRFSVLRVWQAMAAWLLTVSTAAGRALMTAADAAAQRTALGLGTAATTASSAYATAAQGGTADSAAQIAGDLAGTAAAPVVAKINGVAVTGTPTAGQVPTATSGAAATWQTPSGASYEVATFADLPDPTTVTAGRVYTVLGAICTGGARGTQWQSNGTFWRPAGAMVLVDNTTQIDGVSGGTTSAQILWSPQLPAGVFRGCRRVILRSRFIASAADTNSRTLRWRVGANGTTSDALVASFAVFSANNRQCLFPAQFVPVSNTTVRHAYINTTTPATADTAVGSTNTIETHAPDTTVSDMLTTSLYVSLEAQQGASPTSTLAVVLASVAVE